MLNDSFFDQDACVVAQSLLGKIIYRKIDNTWLKVRVIETEAYYIHDKASHSSCGRTPSREAMFMSPGTIYMYYARGRSSLNISVAGLGNAVLIKSGYPDLDHQNTDSMLTIMRMHYNDLNRGVHKLCNGQTLLCQALGLTVHDWNKKKFSKNSFFIKDEGIQPKKIIATTRLGIPQGRDEHLPYRFIDEDFIKLCSKAVNK